MGAHMKLQVEFLNTYTITTEDDHCLSFNNINSSKLAILLAYILYHHRHKLSTSDLQELMFGTNGSSNPANALKALIFRLRALLNNNLGKNNYILSSQGTYYWNPEIELDFDVDNFINYYRLGRNETDDLKKVAFYQKALLLYQGDFLPMIINNNDKLMNIRHFLTSYFLNVANFLIEYYLRLNEFSLVEEICQAVLAANEADENINCILVFALVKQGKKSLAIKHYQKVQNSLTISSANKMQHYLELDDSNKHEVDFNIIYEDLNGTVSEGAFVCDYEFFKSIYQLALRTTSRKGAHKSIVLLTIHPKEYITKNPEINNLVLGETSHTLQQIMIDTFRASDVVCKYSIKQFLILLDCNYQGAIKAIKRVKKKFYLQEKYERVLVEESISELGKK